MRFSEPHRRTAGVAGVALGLLFVSASAAAQLPIPEPLDIDPKSWGFGQVPVQGEAFVDFEVCKPVSDSLFGGTTIGSSLDNHVLAALSHGPFHIVAGKTLDLRDKRCETVTIRFAPFKVGAYFAWLRFRVQESPFSPGNRRLFHAFALIVGSSVRREGIFFVDVDVEGSGRVVGPFGVTCPPRCHFEFVQGVPATFTAEPGSREGIRYPHFRGWEGACAGQLSSRCSFPVTQDETVRARFGTFSPPPTPFVPLTVEVAGEGRVFGPELTCEGPTGVCSRSYPAGSTLTLGANGKVFALPAFVHKPFLGWGGACESRGQADHCTLTLTGETRVTAEFGPGTTAVRRGLFVTRIQGEGRVTTGGIDCPGDCGERFRQQARVTLTAHPGEGWTFDPWTWGGACAGQGNPCVVTMNTDKTVTASFRPRAGWAAGAGAPGAGGSRLTTRRVGNGRIEGAPISCPPVCSAEVPTHSPVTLAALPATFSRFAGWTGACAGRDNPCRLYVSRDETTTALFAQPLYALNVNVTGQGRVTVGDQPSLQGCCSHHGGVCGCGGDFVACCDATFSPTCSCTEIHCPGDCSETYAAGEVVTLTATPGRGRVFAGWGGACSGTSPTCEVVMSSPKTVSARFEREES